MSIYTKGRRLILDAAMNATKPLRVIMLFLFLQVFHHHGRCFLGGVVSERRMVCYVEVDGVLIQWRRHGLDM